MKQYLNSLFRSNHSLLISLTVLWFIFFLVIPLLIVFKISFSQMAVSIPPYTNLFHWANGSLHITASFANYLFLFTDALYAAAYLSSLKIAFISTILCLLIGYPMAYAIARTPTPLRHFLLMLVVLPSWTSFLIRIYAWMGILKNNGMLNQLLMSLGIIDQPLALLHTDFAVYLGIVYGYLPFMILPLYAILVKIDYGLLDAAMDLGARPWKAFWSITIPLSKAGIIAGAMLVFIPAVGEFVIPDLLGGPDTLMIGKVLWQEFFNNRDWPVASAVAVVMVIMLMIPILLFTYYQNKSIEEERS